MPDNFDEIIERRGTGALKWDCSELFTEEQDLLPFWVADMDFKPPREVIKAIKDRADHGVFGYTVRPESYYESVVSWMKKRFGWEVDREWFVFTPGIVPSLYIGVQAFTDPGDSVIVQQPVYYPFMSAVNDSGRKLKINPLKKICNSYTFDFEQLEQEIDSSTKLLILCSPHNPVGRVWSREELSRLAEICKRNNIVILSDEIHADLVFEPNAHIPLASISPEYSEVTVTCTAPNKTFNLAGLQMGNVLISNEKLREQFKKAASAYGIGLSNIFGIVATEAAYTFGEPWLEHLLLYLKLNYRLLVDYLAEHLPDVIVHPLEGTYLVWLDMRPLGFSDEDIVNRLRKKAKIWLDEGTKFGVGGEGHQRINIACRRSLLKEGLEKLVFALS